MKVFLDLDGVLVDFVSKAHEYHGISPNLYLDEANHGKWDFDVISGIPLDRFWSKFDYDFWANLDWMPDGKEILSLIEDRFGRDNITILTSPQKSNRGECITGKIDWVERHMPRYANNILLGRKKHMLAHADALLIDDADHNITDFQKHGGQIIQVPRIWNQLHSHSNMTIDYLKENLNV